MTFTIPSNDLATDPAIQSVVYDTDLAILVAGIAGTGVLTGCDVTAQGTPDMTVAVAAGTIKNADGSTTAVTGGNLTIGAASASNPRYDLISVSSAGVKTYTAGVAAASPKPPDLPSGHIGLAMVLVPTSDTTISTDQITDKRVVVQSLSSLAFSKTKITSDFSTSSSSYADITSAAAALTTGARRCRLVWRSPMYNNVGGNYPEVTFSVDGTDVEGGPADGINMFQTVSGSDQRTIHAEYVTDVLTAGSHTFKARLRSVGGTAHTGATGNNPAFFWVEELLHTT